MAIFTDTQRGLVNGGEIPLSSNAVTLPTSYTAPTMISTSNMGGSSTPISVPNIPVSTTANAISGATDQTLNTQLANQKTAQEATLNTSKNDLTSTMNEYLGIQASKPTVEAGLKVPELSQMNNDAFNALQASKRAQENEIRNLSAQNPNSTKEYVVNLAQEINRKYAFEQADLSIALDVANRNYTSAQNMADRKIQLQLEPLQTKLNFQQQFYNDNKNALTKTEDTQMQLLITKSQNELKQTQDNAQQIKDWNKTVINNGQANLVPQISALNPSSPTFSQDLGKITEQIKAKPDTKTITATDSTGRTTATTINTQTGAIISKTDLGIVNKPIKTATSFTTTQLNKGANNAGLSQTDFSSLDSDVKNYYINSTPTDIKNMNGVFAEITSGNKTVDEVKTLIDSANIPDSVKTYLKQKADSASLPEPSFLSKTWDSIKGFLGF